MDCQFSFGPRGAFFCKSDSLWAWSDNNTLPEPLRLIFEDPNHPQANQFPYDVAFPMEPGMFSMAWKTKRGDDYYEELFLGPRYEKLATFMKTIAQDGQHITRTVFGPNHSYFTISPGGFSWQHLPEELESNITGRAKKAHPTNVALGAYGSFVVLFSDGIVIFDVADHYPDVERMIRDSAETSKRKGIAFVALNPHAAGQYYVAYGDGSASWNIPNDWVGDVTTVSKTLRPVNSSSAPLGFAAAAGGTAAGFAANQGGLASPTSPGSGGSMATSAIHGLGQLYHTYSQQQQQNILGGQPQQNFFPTGNTGGFDPNSLNTGGVGFNPSSLNTGGIGFDPSSLGVDPGTIASGLVSGLDPNTVASTLAGVAGAFFS